MRLRWLRKARRMLRAPGAGVGQARPLVAVVLQTVGIHAGQTRDRGAPRGGRSRRTGFHCRRDERHTTRALPHQIHLCWRQSVLYIFPPLSEISWSKPCFTATRSRLTGMRLTLRCASSLPSRLTKLICSMIRSFRCSLPWPSYFRRSWAPSGMECLYPWTANWPVNLPKMFIETKTNDVLKACVPSRPHWWSYIPSWDKGLLHS